MQGPQLPFYAIKIVYILWTNSFIYGNLPSKVYSYIYLNTGKQEHILCIDVYSKVFVVGILETRSTRGLSNNGNRWI